MSILIIYDSLYGNTKKIAEAIAGALSLSNKVKLIRAKEADISDLKSTSLLIVGSPVQAGRPMPSIKEFLDNIPVDGLKNIKVAAFDTRVKIFFAKIFGYAADRMAKNLKSKGGNIIALPEGFFVTGKEGPLKIGEKIRAADWAKKIISN